MRGDAPRANDGLVGALLGNHALRGEGDLHVLLVADGARDVLLGRDGLEDGVLERLRQLHLVDLQGVDLGVQVQRELVVEVLLHRDRDALLVVEEGVRGVVLPEPGIEGGMLAGRGEMLRARVRFPADALIW